MVTLCRVGVDCDGYDTHATHTLVSPDWLTAINAEFLLGRSDGRISAASMAIAWSKASYSRISLAPYLEKKEREEGNLN